MCLLLAFNAEMAIDSNSARIGRIKLTGLLDSVRFFKVKAQFGSMLDVLNQAPALFKSSILKVLLGSINLDRAARFGSI